MRKTQMLGWGLIPAALPFWSHQFFFPNSPEIESVVISDKTKAIFRSAEELNYLQFPTKLSYISMMSKGLHEQNLDEDGYLDRDEIAVSYNEGNRFISWSGLFSFLYKHHWQFSLMLWAVTVYLFGGAVGLWEYICAQYPAIPMC